MTTSLDPSGIQSTFSAASGPSAVAMATVWLVPAEPKPGETGKEKQALQGSKLGARHSWGSSWGCPGALWGLDHQSGRPCLGENVSIMFWQVNVSLWG